MELTGGISPVFRAPWPEWKIIELDDRPAPAESGRLELRIGYCRPMEGYTVAEGIEDLSRRKHAGMAALVIDARFVKADLSKAELALQILLDGRPIAASRTRMWLQSSPGDGSRRAGPG